VIAAAVFTLAGMVAFTADASSDLAADAFMAATVACWVLAILCGLHVIHTL
jgi:hypothetical protein